MSKLTLVKDRTRRQVLILTTQGLRVPKAQSCKLRAAETPLAPLNRKAKRAQKARERGAGDKSPPVPAPPAKSKAERRVEVAATRFAAPGAEKVWQSLLAWEEPRRARIWLAQAVHDAARGKERAAATGTPFDTALVVAGFQSVPRVRRIAHRGRRSCRGRRLAELGRRLHAAAILRRSGRTCPRSRRVSISATCRRATYQDDWEIGPVRARSWAPRAPVMQLLGQVEVAALGLNAVTQSENVGAIAGAAACSGPRSLTATRPP